MSDSHKIHVEFPGRILLIGFGSIGQGVLPLLLRHVGIAPERVTIVTAEDKGSEEAAKYGIRFVKERLTRENYRRVLNPLLGRGDFLINVSVEVSSIALIKLCWEKGAMYLDTCIEPWPGGYTDPTVPAGRPPPPAPPPPPPPGGPPALPVAPPCTPSRPSRRLFQTHPSRCIVPVK